MSVVEVGWGMNKSYLRFVTSCRIARGGSARDILPEGPLPLSVEEIITNYGKDLIGSLRFWAEVFDGRVIKKIWVTGPNSFSVWFCGDIPESS